MIVFEVSYSPVMWSPPPGRWRRSHRHDSRGRLLFGAATVASLLFLLTLWNEFGGTTASAATELNRLMRPRSKAWIGVSDRCEERWLSRIGNRHTPEAGRPPKPPLDDAVLYVRHAGQFVLMRPTPSGSPFITGSNGEISWAVKPDGSVRFSQPRPDSLQPRPAGARA